MVWHLGETLIDDISRFLGKSGYGDRRARGSLENRRGEAERLRLRYVRPPCFSNHIHARIKQNNSEERKGLRACVLEFAHCQDRCTHGKRVSGENIQP